LKALHPSQQRANLPPMLSDEHEWKVQPEAFVDKWGNSSGELEVLIKWLQFTRSGE